MAQEEIIFKLKVDAGDSASKVNSVDKEFDSLRGSIKDTEKEVENLSKQFGDNSKEADTARKKLAQLNLAYEDLSRAATDVNAKFDEIYGELQPLTARMGEAEDRLYELALAGKQNTKEYQDLLETVGRYKQTQMETDRIVDNAAQTFTQKLGSAIQGAASGFQLVQGASALFGEENEELEKTLLKVQSAMALAEGIEGVRVALPMFVNFGNVIKTHVVTAFTSLRGAIMATGIGALIVAVGVLINEWMEYSKSVEEAENKQEKLNEENEKSLALINEVADASEKARNYKKGGLKELERELELLRAKGATEKEIHEKSKQILEKELFNLAVRQESYDQSNAKEREAAWETYYQAQDVKNKLKVLDAEYYKKLDDKQKEANEKAKEKRNQDLEDIRQNKIRQIELENARILEQETLENAYYDSFKTQQQLEEQAVRDKYFTILQTTKDNETLLLAQQKELDAIANKYKEEADKQESDRLNNIAQQYEDFVTQYTEAVNSASENEKLAVNEKYNYLIEKAKEYGFSTVELEKKRAEELKEIDKELLQAKENFVSEVSNMLGALSSSAAEGSRTQKAFAVAQLTIDTAKSISSVISGATAAAAAGGPAAPFLIGGYIASGIATVTKAMSTAKKLLAAPLPSVAPPSANRPTENAQGTQQGTQQTIQAQSTYKVVVVDSDITKMQDKTKKVNAISTI